MIQLAFEITDKHIKEIYEKFPKDKLMQYIFRDKVSKNIIDRSYLKAKGSLLLGDIKKTNEQLWLKPKNMKVSDFIIGVTKQVIESFKEKDKKADTNIRAIFKNPKENQFFHATHTELYKPGEIIKGYWDPLEKVKGGMWAVYLSIKHLEEIFEKHRPSSKPPRLNSVFAFKELDDLVNNAKKLGRSYIYMVEPLGKYHIADMNIIDEFESIRAGWKEEDEFAETAKQRKDNAKKYGDLLMKEVKLYWEGKPSAESNKRPKWEVICGAPGVKVISLVKL
ncbi:MAG TPA: hypothetical protein PLA71_00865 [Saccharofermentans sp.]|nr:hypothetical protein [Saccharofermentans sp.]